MAIECWAVVEIMGHIKTAGRCSEETKFGVPLLRVDVPDRLDREKFRTSYFGGSSIFAFHPVDEDVARTAAASVATTPMYETTIAQLVERQKERAIGNAQSRRQRSVFDDDDDGNHNSHDQDG